MAMNTFFIHIERKDKIEYGHGLEDAGTGWIDIGEDVSLFFGTSPEEELENIERLMAVLMDARNRITRALTGAECVCVDPICSKEHPVDRLDAIDQAKRAREIDEKQVRKLEAAARIADQMDEAEYDREGDPAFNGSFR